MGNLVFHHHRQLGFIIAFEKLLFTKAFDSVDLLKFQCGKVCLAAVKGIKLTEFPYEKLTCA